MNYHVMIDSNRELYITTAGDLLVLEGMSNSHMSYIPAAALNGATGREACYRRSFGASLV